MILLSLKYSTFITILLTGTLLLFVYAFSFIENRNSIYIYSTFGSAGNLFSDIIRIDIHEYGHIIMYFIFISFIKYYIWNDFYILNWVDILLSYDSI